MKLFFIPIFIVCCLFSACAGNKSLRDKKCSYLESVKLNFDAGEEALKAADYEKAITYFQFVRSKYPFSQYAALSDLKIADAKFDQKRWLDAASAYEVFIRLHPRHEQVSYASFRIGVSYFNAIPDDFFLLPASTSRDQTFTKDALAALDRFLVQFPASDYVAEAKKMRLKLYSKLARNSLEIAAYYSKRGCHQAAFERYASIENLYPESDESAEALFKAAEICRLYLNDEEQAAELYLRIINTKKDSPYIEQARAHFGKLHTETESQD